VLASYMRGASEATETKNPRMSAVHAICHQCKTVLYIMFEWQGRVANGQTVVRSAVYITIFNSYWFVRPFRIEVWESSLPNPELEPAPTRIRALWPSPLGHTDRKTCYTYMRRYHMHSSLMILCSTISYSNIFDWRTLENISSKYGHLGNRLINQ